ncbi:MAG: DUF1553 domain-containing protein [Planctomycetaceae bacterium]|nr:DUF1553 domain-containing protein [Planctomycetaceae bacterium]
MTERHLLKEPGPQEIAFLHGTAPQRCNGNTRFTAPRRSAWPWLSKTLVVIAVVGNVAATGQSGEVDFQKDILPIFQQHCLDCHGSETAEADLRLTTELLALKGGDSGEPLIRPGHGSESYLIQRLTTTDAAQRMPPESEPLTEQQVHVLKTWIDDAQRWLPLQEQLGQQKIEHWSFLPPMRPEVPSSQYAGSIDAFLAQRLTTDGLTFSKPASRRKLIRRLYLVMHGLPPQPEQVTDFENDASPDAWERLVDRVLQDPAYGERWATYWLDLVRFGETHGFETNRERPHAWRYRDWVIDALNQDKPYDQFVMEQIAGDALGADLGTGFLVAGPYDLVKGQDPMLRLMQRQDELADIINTTGTTFLGLTLGCARCHNHKFDPISQTDYYGLQAVFAGVNHSDRTLPLPADRQQEVDRLDARIVDLKQQLEPFIRHEKHAALLLDDSLGHGRDSDRMRFLQTPAGQGKNPDGTGRGFAKDAGSDLYSPNVSGGSYTWWKNQPQTDVVAYRPLAAGKHRIHLSWGCGWSSHTADAHYQLDHDGNLATLDDRTTLAVVDQQRFADGSGDVPGKALWSGFHSAGVHDLTTDDVIVLRCGNTGTAITADVILLEPVSKDASPEDDHPPTLRAAVAATGNVERFPALEAGYVRFEILESNNGQPCLDELEVFSGDRNVALASTGTVASSSGDFVHPLHKLAHINDGQHGNAHSWICSDITGWVQLQFPQSVAIDRIQWARDREGKYSDRLAVQYRILASKDGEHWHTIADSSDRLPAGSQSSADAVQYSFAGLPADKAQAGRRLLEQLSSMEQLRNQLAQPVQAYAGTFSQPGPTHRLYRGEPTSPREEVVPSAIRSLTSLQLPADAVEQQRRLEIARWIASDDNPLTARVMVNRIWQHHFGSGIVDTPSDFGRNGTPPSHPELLDWLACEFMDSGWSIRHIQKLILMSAAWQQDSVPRDDGLAIDASSRLLWRFPPRRLNAESIRDCMLAVTGHLNPSVGGPGFSAFEVELENVRHYFPKTSFGPDDWRRMIYMTKVRQERDAVFGSFDCPDCSQVVPKRTRSTTPLQALNLFNSRFVLQQANLFAERLTGDDRTPEESIQLAWQLCYGRSASTEEVRAAADFVRQTNWPQFARALLNSNEFVFIP